MSPERSTDRAVVRPSPGVSRRAACGFAVLAAAAIALGFSACRRPSPNPPPDDGARIVPLSPALAETLRGVGLGDRIVARHDYDFLTPPSVPTVGHQEGIDYERLLAVRPTHVLVQWGRRDLPPRLRRLADEQGWVLENFPLTTLDEVRDAARWIHEHLAPDAADPVAALDAALRPEPALAGVGPVLLLAQADPPAAVGPGSFHHDILIRIGAVPALRSGSAWMPMDAEDVRRLAPGAIVLVLPRGPDAPPAPEPAWDDLRRRLGRLADLDIPAIRDRRVAVIDDPAAFIPAPGPLAGFAEGLRRRLQAWSRATPGADGATP